VRDLLGECFSISHVPTHTSASTYARVCVYVGVCAYDLLLLMLTRNYALHYAFDPVMLLLMLMLMLLLITLVHILIRLHFQPRRSLQISPRRHSIHRDTRSGL
jgi:sterol desaturase/sphingolipid hydroxylase (fatty acid hydroxylase superfamily)